jgi:type II secretory pathway pseudopilin PulG
MPPLLPLMPLLPEPNRQRTAGGFTYLGMMIFIAIIGIISSTSLHLGSIVQRRDAEEQLLDIGNEFRRAIISYANASKPGANRAPQSLQDLLHDPRYPNTVRHLRKIRIDPITGSDEWGLVASIDGNGIIGVFSLSTDKPIKIGNFDPALEDFSTAASYNDWRFLGAPR